jgi:multidrug efflux system membrane fusion protein
MNKTILILAAAVIAAGCSRNDADAKKTAPAVPVEAAQAVETNVPVLVHAIGNVTPVAKVTVRAQITDKLETVHFKEGQPVKQGDLLFTLDPRPMQAALDAAKANLARDTALLENAKIELGRDLKLFDEKIVSQDEIDTNKAGVDASKSIVDADAAAVANATLNLEFCFIRSPVDGVTGSQQVFAGDVVKSPDDVMLMINQVRPIYVVFAVPEQYLAQIRDEMSKRTLKVETTFAGFQGPPPQGELTFVDNSVDTTTGTIQLKGTFPNEDNILWPGQFVQVTLNLSEIEHAVVVPSQAIQTGQNGDYVYVVKPDLTVALRRVTTGQTGAGETVVTSGLQAGETVVTDGQLLLEDGSPVSLKNPAAPASTNATTVALAKP